MQNKHKNPQDIVTGAFHFLEDFQHHSSRGKATASCKMDGSCKPPNAGWEKIKFDEAMFMDGVERFVALLHSQNLGSALPGLYVGLSNLP
ncbi:UNVERIFIED_CONTAM: hypothetical protein Slati_1140000 [Sesamum latifolium]|uniref:Uncharacterized protein n=1 Tax=Sesamum latifolium TaxID=2727402 RepID=A0AAW2XEG5_9LAMI